MEFIDLENNLKKLEVELLVQKRMIELLMQEVDLPFIDVQLPVIRATAEKMVLEKYGAKDN